MAKTISNKKRNEARRRRNNLTVILIIAAFAIVVVGMIIISQSNGQVDVTLPNLPAKPQPSGMNLGDPNAPVKVVEFADFQCVVCHEYWLKMESSILDTYVATGKVYYTFANFAFFGKESSDAAAAAYCANDQGKFWEYHDVIFANYKGENVGGFVPKNLKAFAESLGLDMTAFNSCFDSGKYAQKVIDDAAYARSQNVTGTPSFLVNGKLVYANDLAATIEAALAGK
jgi:protein-disulfide isomerase